MDQDKKPSTIKTAIVTAIISTLFTIIGSVILVYFNREEPTLKYEVLPVSYFKADSLKITIVTVRIINDGNKECENISFAPKFGDSLSVSDYTFQKSSLTIKMNKEFDTAAHSVYYTIPYLNPKEQILCSFYFHKIIDSKDIEIDLRSKGNVGVKTESKNPNILSTSIYLFTTGMLVLTIGLIIFIIFYQRKVIKYQFLLQRLEYQRTIEIAEANGLNWEAMKAVYKNANKLNTEPTL